MEDKTCIVTGGNAGIGKEIAVALARMQLHVVIVSRDPEKGRAALEYIKNESSNDSVDLAVGTLDSIRQVRSLARELSDRYAGMAVLVNNAGVWQTEKKLNEDGLEYSFMVNHMAPLLLSTILRERLQSNAPARIVNVNAGLYIFGRCNLDRTPFGHDFSAFKTYMNTKLCNILFTRKFAGIIESSGLTINAVHPGVIRTNLGNSGGAFGWLLRNVIKRVWNTPREGAGPPVWLATSPDVEGLNGRYFELCAEKPYTENALDDALMEKLYAFSMKMAQL
jgi:NAD(P)-dependent dehydrogenase (short-subunit alcohol dehydrogenase family)